MMKKFTIIVLLMVLLKATLFGQGATASLTSVTPTPGQTFSVSLMVTNFSNISSITFVIKFDPAVLTPMLNSQGKLNLTNLPTGYDLSNFIGYIRGGNELVITFSEQNTVNILNGKLFDINFTSYCGTNGTTLDFQNGCEVDQGIPPVILPVIYSSGQVSNGTPIATAQIGFVTYTYDMSQPSVLVPINFSSFTNNVGSIQLNIQYDPTKLTYINIAGTGVLSNGLVANVSNGNISIVWTNASGNGAQINASIFNLRFAYTGTDVASLNFTSCCLFGNSSGTGYLDVNYINGSVSPDVPTAFATLDTINNAVQGQDYEVPLNFSGFQTAYPDAIGAYTLHVIFDNPKLSFIEVTNNANSAIVNPVGDTINIVWTNTSASNINGQALKLKFKYNGVARANIKFNSGCNFSNLQGSSINVGYTNATISPEISTINATIESVSGIVGTNILVPIDFSGLPTNMGAVTMNINYDNTRLTFIDAQNNTYGATILLNPSTQKIQIAWSSASATNINGTFLKLRFAYNFGGNGSGSVISFADGCELTDNTASIIPVNWNNGGVNLKSKISGILTYNNDTLIYPSPGIPLVGFKVYLMSGSGNNILDSLVTDSNGYYQFMTINGTYIIESSAPIGEYWYADLDDVMAIYNYVANGIDFPEQNSLKLLAADVDQNGDIDFDDVITLYNRVVNGFSPDFTAPDFLFETPTVIVNSADMLNQNILGICSGNVLGSDTNP